MDKYNFFSGIRMPSTLVSQYYPPQKNSPNALFDHFVFQPMLDDGSKSDDNFTLAVYAVDVNLKVLNNGEQLKPTTELNDNIQGTKPNIQFANMKLFLPALGIIYPNGVNLDLKVYPPGGYYWQNGKETAYVLYIANAGDGDGNGTEGNPTVPVNPSPPY